MPWGEKECARTLKTFYSEQIAAFCSCTSRQTIVEQKKPTLPPSPRLPSCAPGFCRVPLWAQWCPQSGTGRRKARRVGSSARPGPARCPKFRHGPARPAHGSNFFSGLCTRSVKPLKTAEEQSYAPERSLAEPL